MIFFPALREAVADYYNRTYRENKDSKYTYENVCIVPGGRAGLSRVAAVIGDVYTVRSPSLAWVPIPIRFCCWQSYQIPDYTAYDQVLSAFKRLVPVPTAYVFAFILEITPDNVFPRVFRRLEPEVGLFGQTCRFPATHPHPPQTKYRLDIQQTKVPPFIASRSAS